MKLTGHKTVAMFMHYVHTEDKPVRDAAELVASRRLAITGRRALRKQRHDRRPRSRLSCSDCRVAVTTIGCAAPTSMALWRCIDKYTRFGYSSEVEMTSILKRKDFARWQASEKLPDGALCRAVKEMEDGLIDADLGGFLYKKRVARPGGGKSGGYRTLLSARIGDRYVFLHGFPKNDKANITQDEKKALQFAGKVFLELSGQALSQALKSGVLLEVHCEQDH